MTRKKHNAGSPRARPQTALRIIGGRLRGRLLAYAGDPRTRPMKDRTREATFNLLGPAVKGTHAVDLFAGTGALGLEALSRGAARATLIERHFPTARLISENVANLAVGNQAEVVAADVFVWVRQAQKKGPELWEASALEASTSRLPWLVFCAPPYSFYEERAGDMVWLIDTLIQRAPPDSLFVVEAEQTFDVVRLPNAEAWDVRRYAPAVLALYQTASDSK